jgi:hypothetical protein
MDDTTRIDQLLNQENQVEQPPQPQNEDALVNDILSKIKQQESASISPQSNIGLTVENNPSYPQSQPQPQQGQQPPQLQYNPSGQQNGIINDPNPNTTINQQVDPEISRTIQRQKKEVRFMNETEDEDDEEDDNINQFELQNDVNFSLTDLIIRELRKPIIFAFLLILALLPISNQLIERFLPFVASSDVLTLSLKTFICTLIFYILNKLSLF